MSTQFRHLDLSSLPVLSLLGALGLLLVAPAKAGPTVVPTAEGQIGETPAAIDAVFGSRVEFIRNQQGGLLHGLLLGRGGLVVPPPEFQFLTDMIHGYPEPVPITTDPAAFTQAFDKAPASASSPNATDTGDWAAFAYAVDGSGPGLIDLETRVFDDTGTQITAMTVIDVPVAPNFPDPNLSDVDVAVDQEGRVTVAYTELDPMVGTRVKGQRFGADGNPIGGAFDVTDDGHASSEVALLDPAGNRLLVATSTFNTIAGNIVDFSGGALVVLPEFTISTTPAAFGNLNQAAASDPTTGTSIVAWENNSAVVGDPVNIFARRFDAMGNPIGNDFRVNTTTLNAQGQPAVAMGPGGVSAVAWAGDAAMTGDELDVFLQVYGPNGQPIGGEIKANTDGTGFQDRPTVRFLRENDSQGRPQVAVFWRDVGNVNGNFPRGTGTSYRCFSIQGLGEPPIFADGFESGDTTSWSDMQP